MADDRKSSRNKTLSYIKSVEIENKNEDDGLSPTHHITTGLEWEKNIQAGRPTTLVLFGYPKKGETIAINDSTLAYYGTTIKLYDHNKDVKIEGGKLIIDGKEVTEYTFKQNYYFMMGDNRHNSLDSRFWGFVPEDHIVGKAFFIWLSIDKNADFLHKIRWSRFFNLIR